MTRWMTNAQHMLRIMGITCLLLLLVPTASDELLVTTHAAGGTSLRFYGTDASELDRVQIPLGPMSNGQITDSYPVNVAGDFTIEFWMKATAVENSAPFCENGWYYGNIIIDRDVDGSGDYGDYGIALCAGRIAFGVSVGDDDRQLVGETSVTDGQWHHIAVTRADGGRLAIFIDGRLDGSTDGPSGPVNYRLNRETSQPGSDPYLVLGAEKHGYPGSFHYDGLIDDLHISSVVRYTAPFARPDAVHSADGASIALYRFDEGEGSIINDSAGAAGGPSTGMLIVAGSPVSPVWSVDTPFAEPIVPVEVTALLEVSPTPEGPTSTIAAVTPETESSLLAGAASQPSTTTPSVAGGDMSAAAATIVAGPTAVMTVPTPVPPRAPATDALAGPPPPTNPFDTLLLAWLAVAGTLGVALFLTLWQRLRG